jgi:hypothetical protein
MSPSSRQPKVAVVDDENPPGSATEVRRRAQSWPKVLVPMAPASPSVRVARVPSGFQL